MKVLKLVSCKGSITVFISIVLSSIFLVVGIFTDAARIKLAHSQVQRANQTALSSVLACYNNQLKDQYGLFGFYLENEILNDSFEEYFSKNLNVGGGDFLYGYNIENICLEQKYNLENKQIFERQIMEFMKYRAPAEIASDLLSKVDGIKNISGGSKLYKRKMETDKKAAEIGGLQMLLEDKTNKINMDNSFSKIMEVKENFLAQGKEIDTVRDELSNINKAKDDLKNTLINYLYQFKNINNEAREYAINISVKKSELLKRIDEEIETLNQSDKSLEEIDKAYKDSMNSMKNIIGEDNSEEIIGGLERNISNCQNVIDKIAKSDAELIYALEQFPLPASVGYTFNKAGPATSEDKDNRDQVLQTVKKAFTQKGEMKCIDNVQLQQLPSRKRKLPEEIINWNLLDFNTSDGAEKELDYLSEKQDSFEHIASNLTANLFLNEYIMGIFRHDVPLLKNEEESKAYNLRSEDKFQRDGFFSNYEVEYIINGNKDEAVNSMIVKSQITAIRLVANVIHIYTDPSKMSRVTSLAAALSSWNAGLSTPLIQTMIVFSWAMFEALYDLEQLSLGEKIALYKTKEQWKTDISGAVVKSNEASSKNNPFLLSYQDYLRIFLLLTDNEKKIARTQDLVQLNVGLSCPDFLLENTGITIKADTTVSIKNLFLSLTAFTTASRRNISRTNIIESMAIGY